jgi:hypothetical protein
LVGQGQPVRVVIDDTLFHRVGRKVFGAAWQHDGSAKGRHKTGRGVCFVIAAILVELPFCSRPIALPVLFRLWRPNTTDSKPSKPSKPRVADGDRPAKTALARQMIDLLVGALPGRQVHVAADAAYRGKPLHGLPAGVRWVSRLPVNAELTGPTPPRTGKRGRPRLRGDRLGKPAELDAALTWRTITVLCYGEQTTLEVASPVGQWYGSWHTTPLKIALVRHPGRRKLAIALYCTDPQATDEQIITDYAGRWPIETAIQNGKQITGAGQAHNRLQNAVQRTTPFALLAQSLVIL